MALLSSLFGPPTPDPLGKLLGSNYDPNAERAAKISGLLHNMSAALLNPQRHVGDIGQIGRIASEAGKGYKSGGTSYLQEAMARKLAADKLKAQQDEEASKARQDEAKADFIAQNPQYREFIEMYPKEFGEFWQKHMMGEEGLLKGADWGVSPKAMKDSKGNIFYRSFNKAGETKITPEVPGTTPVGQLKMIETVGGMVPVDPYSGAQGAPIPGSEPGAIKGAETAAGETAKATVDQTTDDLPFTNTSLYSRGSKRCVSAFSPP